MLISNIPNFTFLSSNFLTTLRRQPLSSPLPPLRRNAFRVDMTSVATMSSSSPPPQGIPPVPDRQIVVGVGGVTVDYLATVVDYPKPDDKIRSTSLKVQGGGNAGNALTCAARLGLKPRIISKVANDAQGRSLLAELEEDGVDVSYIVVSEEGNSPFTYIIVDSKTNSRTCIHTPGYPPMVPGNLSQSSLISALDGARLVYFDVRLHETALVVAQEAIRQNIPILVDAERKRDGLDDLLNLASYVVCTEKFPQTWAEACSIPSALVAMLVRLPNLRFVIVTLGEKGCIMLERSDDERLNDLETNVDSLLEVLQKEVNITHNVPTCISSKTHADMYKILNHSLYVLSCLPSMDKPTDDPTVLPVRSGVIGKLHLGTAEKIPPSELVDTTGAGDAFIGAVLYAICAGMPPEKMLPFASRVAAAGCRGLGARTSLPRRTDPRLVPFL